MIRKWTFRKKPIVVEAMQYTGDPCEVYALQKFVGNALSPYYLDSADSLGIATLEGKMLVSVGDWIIKGVKGEFYPCKPDIFEATYEKVEG